VERGPARRSDGRATVFPQAIAETLAGVNNPAGRLPVTFYESLDQVPAFADYSMKGRTYRYFKGNRCIRSAMD
jgi:hypothetical protein